MSLASDTGTDAIITDLASPDEAGTYLSIFSIWKELKKLKRENRKLDIDRLFVQICQAQGRPLQEEPGQEPSPAMKLAPLTFGGRRWYSLLKVVKGYKFHKESEPKRVKCLLRELHVPRKNTDHVPKKDGTKGGASPDNAKEKMEIGESSEDKEKTSWVKFERRKRKSSSRGVSLRIFGVGGGGLEKTIVVSGMATDKYDECMGQFTEIKVRTTTYKHRIKKWKKRRYAEPVEVVTPMFEERLTHDRCKSKTMTEADKHNIHPSCREWDTNVAYGGIRGPRPYDMALMTEYGWTWQLGAEFKNTSVHIQFEHDSAIEQTVTWMFPPDAVNVPVYDEETLEKPSGFLPYFVRRLNDL